MKAEAISLVTDPENVALYGDRGSELRVVRDRQVVQQLREKGLSEKDAKRLAIEAVKEVGGRIESAPRRQSLMAGRCPRPTSDHWVIPASAVRED